MAEAVISTESTSPTSASSLPLPRGKDYHAFICFNTADDEWVDETLAYLESPEIGFKCVDHRRDFIPGKTVLRNIDEFLEKSWKYVLVMTPEYVESDMCKMETDIMMNMSVEQQEECVIPVLLKPCLVPRALRCLTYIDVNQSDNWKEKLLKAMRRTDISQSRKDSKEDKQEEVMRARKYMQPYQQCVDNYRNDKIRLELERKSLENDVHKSFSVLSKRLNEELERQKNTKLKDIHNLVDKRLASLGKKLEVAKTIISTTSMDPADNAVSDLTYYLNEFEEMDKRQKETSSLEFVVSNNLVKKLAELMSDSDVGYLREIDLPQIGSEEERTRLPKEITPLMAFLKQSEHTPRSTVKCPAFKFDNQTVKADRSILPDGMLSNQPPSGLVPPSDRRLRKYGGAVGTVRFAPGCIYYWQNKVNVNLEKKLEDSNLLFEVALSTRGVFDEKHTTDITANTLTLNVARCTKHPTDTVCLEVYKNNVWTHHQTLHPNIKGPWSTLLLGFLLDTIRHRWTVYDVTKKEVITTVKDIGDVEEFTPMFGVYARTRGSVKLSLITGSKVKLSEDMYKVIEKALY